MNIQGLEKLYTDRGCTTTEIENAISAVKKCNKFFGNKIDEVDISKIKEYLLKLIEDKQNSIEELLALARYFLLEDKKDIYIFFTQIFGSLGVVEEIKKRMIKTVGIKKTEHVFQGLIEPVLGTTPDAMPGFTNSFMKNIEDNLTEEEMKKVLAGNNHQIPVSAMLSEKEAYEKAANLEVYLRERHQRKVDVLERHKKEGKVWFEQVINQEVIDYVRGDQEILSAVLKDGSLYITKIPYDTKAFLEAETEQEKRYAACHCAFARESIPKGLSMDPNWCYCSAGFAKFPFEIIFGRDLDIELLETPLKGDLRCRFRIPLPKELYINCNKVIKNKE